ncbi:class I adenylate-forming enzyme family protein [Fodinicola acaciae]|uniref:class I adenylate-forming enzyme family protein n=1 Tax=Fodinicola acaciae TaxID=2681555 RepID=UPI001FE5A6EC|nr:class I adenylate-forming enzyme family protein [Fodinicola acaciae]
MTTQQSLQIKLADHHLALLGKTIPQALDHAARTWGDRPALSFVEAPDRLSWTELADEVARVRTGLTNLGLVRGERVGIMTMNQIEFPLAWLAVIDAGAVAVPLNPKYTRREIEFLLDDVDANWLITTNDVLREHDSATFATVPAEHVIVAGDSAPDTATRFADLRAILATSRTYEADVLDLIGIQFTSGSTGLPKGCMLTHQYWVDAGAYGAALFGDPQHILADHPFYYMQNQAYFFQALASGGQLHITPGLSRRKFMQWLVDYEIDHAWIDEDLLEQPVTELDTQLKLKLAPVEGMPPELHKALEERFGLKARDLYASTEVHGGTFHPWDRDDLVGSGSMGLAFPNRETKIVDSDFNEVPPGAPGELVIRGPGMMLGYWNRPEANAELFLPGGWFRTGDIVRKTDDGYHYYIGRVRDVIRRSGENIAAAEVEQQIQSMPGVQEVAAIPVPDDDRDEEVKVIIVASPGAELSAEQVIAWARERLAKFKVPRYVEFRDSLPHLGSGKIAKAELKAEEPFTDAVIDTKPGARQ